MKILKFLKNLSYLWFVGIIGVLLDIDFLVLFFLFGLFGFIEFYFIYVKIRNSDDNQYFGIIIQSLKMIIGQPLILLSCGFKLPNIKNYSPIEYYSLPFNNTWLTVNGGIDKANSHSYNLFNQRYAYDFFIVDETELSYSGDRKDLNNYYCYKQDVLAVADGIVVDLKNKFSDTPIGDVGTAGCSASDIRGNHIVIKHNNQEYSVICHMLKDSFTVSVGDHVVRNQVIGKCGNSGNTSEPHIHFQIQKGKSFYLSAGIPVFFDNIEIINSENNKGIHITKDVMVKNIML